MDANKTLTNRGRSTRKTKAGRGKSIKVVYISTPMKVKTSASKFRSLVQQLTGRDSDIVRIMEANGATDFETFNDAHQVFDSNPLSDEFGSSPGFLGFPAMNSVEESSPTSSESAMVFDDHQVFSSQVDEQLQAMFPMDLFLNLNSSEFEGDVLGSYDAL